jgi:hypothetical protein
MKPYGASVLCCIEDASASSMAALEFAASMACRRRSGDGADLVVVLVCRSPCCILVDPVPAFEWLGAGADVKAMIEGVAADFGLAPRVDEIAGWSHGDIARIARERRSKAVILPMLDDGAGPLIRWRRRGLVSGLIDRTQAVVVDEY